MAEAVAEKRPEILVAIDLGTTFTGVGWARLQPNQPALQTPINIIANWPGCPNRNEQKVPTVLVYNPGGHVSSWGFLCEDDEGPGKQRREFFKIFLEEAMLRTAQDHKVPGAPADINEAKRLVSDFLRQVYMHVKATILEGIGMPQYPGWSNMAVEFIFSVPTTWRSAAIINNFKDAIAAAGFASEGAVPGLHKSSVELTESEGAAVTTLKRANIAFARNDVFMSVDAGGGTTDLALVQVAEPREPFPSLRQVAAVDGVGIGSTLIDRAFVAYLTDRLARFPDLTPQLPPDCVERLARSDLFKSFKHRFGDSVYMLPMYSLTIEGLGYNFNHEMAGIRNGKVQIPHADVQRMFDPHIDSILAKIRGQMDVCQSKYPGLQLQYLNLSGGLGSSPYVKERIQSHLASNPHPCATRIRVIQDPEPQLVVVRGLLWDRMQQLDTGGKNAILGTRVARASYGMVCKMLYDVVKYPHHAHETVEVDQIDGRKFAIGQIEWLIKKGDMVDPNQHITSNFRRKLETLTESRRWSSDAVISFNEPQYLPLSLKAGNARQLCTVTSDLSGVPQDKLEEHRTRGTCCCPGQKYWYCSYDVRAVPAPAEIRFELWKDGKKFSENHKPIDVVWDDAGAQLGNQPIA